MGSASSPGRREATEGRRWRRVLLVGFMGSGKSTVGPLLASHLGWSFLDFDREIERRAGATVARIFSERGEAFFRALEAEVGRDALARERVVLASGGGWAAAPGRLEAVPPDTLSVWLEVDAETALARLERGGPRPLLAGPDPLARAREILGERTPRYRSATLHLDSGSLPPAALAGAIVEHIVKTENRDRTSSLTG